MPTLTLRIDELTRSRLQAVADSRGLSVSDLLREAIGEVLDMDVDRGSLRPAVVPESIGVVDRKQLALLHRILARLVEPGADDERLKHDGDAAYQLDRAEALEAGWAVEYDMEFYAMEAELSRRDCGLVMDILDMFQVLKASMAACEDEVPESLARWLSFSGFDLNDALEGRLLVYARRLLTEGRWEELVEDFKRNDNGNSHARYLGSYRRMLSVFEPMWQDIVTSHRRPNYQLTLEEMKQISEAAIHPQNRRNDGPTSRDW